MIEIIGKSREATEEEIKEYERKENAKDWRENMLKVFLGSRYEKNKRNV